jgi:hypothetical protein
MTDEVVVINDQDTVTVVEPTAVSVHLSTEENNIAIVEVTLENQVVIAEDQKTVVVESSAKGEKGDKGDPADLTPEVINPIIDGRVSQITNTVAEIDAKIANASSTINSQWNAALADAQSEIDSNLAAGLAVLDSALDQAVIDFDVDLTAVNTTLTNAINAAKTELQAADLSLDAKFTNISNTINTNLLGVDTRLDDIELDVAGFDTDLSGINTSLNNTITDLAQFKTATNNGLTTLNDAVFMVDPVSGLVVLKAYHYADDKFNQASISIDALSGEIDLTNQNLTVESNRITSANNRITLLEDGIELRVQYSEMNEAIAGAISAVTPAYSFGFFNSLEGWSAVSGTLTNTGNKVTATKGDITNQALSYLADENPVISLSITRTAGSGWVGDMYITYSGGSTVHYPAVLANVPTGGAFVRTLNLSGEPTYAGTVTGIRFVLGATTSDVFDLDDITIGKPSAAITQLEGIQAQINDLGIELDGVQGQLTNYVTTAFYNSNAVTLNNVSTVLDGQSAIISLKATQTAINSNGTIAKANSASTWVDGANANITSVINTFVAQPNGINAQLGTLTGNYNTLRTEMDGVNNAISSQLVSINGLKIGINDINKAHIYAQLKLKQVENNALAIGDSVSVAKQQIQALSTEQSAMAQQITQLNASYGGYIGQLNSSIINLSKVVSDSDSALATEINKVNSNVNSKIDANYQTLVQSLANANQAIVTSSTQLESKFNAGINALNEEVSNAIASLDFAKSESVELLRGEVYSNFATNQVLNDAIATADEASAQRVTELESVVVNNNIYFTGKITSLQEAISNQESSLAKEVSGLQVSLGVISSGLITKVDLVEARLDSSIASTTEALEAKFNNNMATKQEVTIALANERQATLDDISTLSTSVANNYATKTYAESLVTTEELARIEAINNLSTSVGNTYATITSLNTAISTESSARTSQINNLSSNIASTYATINGMNSAIATETNARTTAINNLSASVAANYATISSMNSAIASETAARTTALNNLSASIAGTYATTSYVDDLVADETQARITYVDSKQAVYDSMYASITRVDSIEATVNTNKASTETSLFVTNNNVKDLEKSAVNTLLQMQKQKENLLEAGSTAAVGQRQIAVEAAQTAIAQEKASLVASIGRLENQANSNFLQVNKAIADEAGNRASALTSLSVDFSGRVAVVQNALNSVSAAVDGTLSSISGINAKLDDPNTGLSATYTTAQSALVSATAGAQAISQIAAQVNNSVTGLSASYFMVQEAYVALDNQARAITELANKVSTVQGDYTEAMVQLSSINDEVDGLYSKAFFGVKSVVNGVATINGVEVNGQTNSILFQANTFGLVDTNGVTQLYYNTASNKWEFKGDLVAGTYQTAKSGFRLELSDDGDLVIWIGNGDKNKDNAVFYVDKTGVVKAKNMELETPTATKPMLKNARLDFVGSTHIRVEAAEPFGPHSLISWFGAIVDGVNFNSATREPILTGLLKSNAITYLSSLGEAYFGGSILAGVLRNAQQSTTIGTNVFVESGSYASNGGLITIKNSCSVSIGRTSTTSATAGNLTGTMSLYRKVGGTWTLVASQGVVGTFDQELETGTYYQSWLMSGSFTYTDTLMSTNNREYRLEFTHALPVAGGGEVLQNLSLISEE